MASSEELKFPVKCFIVQQLACFVNPQAVAKAVKETFKLEVSRQRVHYYDPTTKLGAALAPELKALFEESRKAFLEDISAIGISHKAVQLGYLDRAVALAESRGQIPMVIAVVQAAGGIAGTITHKHEVTGPGGGPLQVVNAARDRVFRRLDDLRERIEGRVVGLAAATGASVATERA
jgi:hypothetical protein